MNILDVIFAIIIGFFLVRGLFRGLLIEAAALVGTATGFFLANAYHEPLGALLGKVLTTQAWASIAAYFLIFVATLVLFTLTAKGLKSILTVSFTAWVDHIAGAVLGVCKGALVCAVILMVLSTFLGQATFITSSQSAPYIGQVSGYLGRFLADRTAELDATMGKQRPDTTT